MHSIATSFHSEVELFWKSPFLDTIFVWKNPKNDIKIYWKNPEAFYNSSKKCYVLSEN